jgi:DMSO/TMAO reductase YedYZ heme-binding membrane subunit
MQVSVFSKYLKEFLAGIIWFCLGILGVSFWFMQTDLVEFGALAGKFAIYIFWLIAIPGILKRFGVKNNYFRNIQIVLMNNRRKLGILMFILVLIHYFWSRAFGYILYGPPKQVILFEFIGFISMLLLIPLAATSNNWSVKKMKKWWYVLHSLSYIVMILAIFHTSMQGMEYLFYYGIPTIIILIIQIISWIFFWQNKSKKLLV